MACNAVFGWNRPRPAPFATGAATHPATSKYNKTKPTSTFAPSVIKAIHAYLDCLCGKGKGGIGISDSHHVAEYKSSEGDDMYHLVAYDPNTGFITASVFNSGTNTGITYKVSNGARDGAALHFVLMPTYLEDQEFKNTMDAYWEQRRGGYKKHDEALRLMAILCDNVHRRLMDETCEAHVALNIETSGNITHIRPAQLSSGRYKPDTVLAGEFVVLANTSAPAAPTAAKVISHSSFVGKYALSSRTLNAYEQSLVPALPNEHVLDERIVSLCLHAQKTTGSNKPMRNFLFRGPSGTGKTEGALAMAAGLGLPHMVFTCSANTEAYDLIGQVFPNISGETTGNEELDAQRNALLAMGGINAENIMKLLKVPTLDDMEYDPVASYEALTGEKKADALPQDCMRILVDTVGEKIQLLNQLQPNEAKQPYIYTETDFIKAIKHGYLIELQEPSVIMQPGVLVGLNSLLEHNGRITLSTGEVIHRHPDTVVVVTTNTMYEGCNALNQSIIDRMDMVLDMELPSQQVIAQRVMQITGFDDLHMMNKMVKVVDGINAYMRHNNILDGNCGVRSLISWVQSTQITGDPYQSALTTIISKATSDKHDQDKIIEAELEPNISKSSADAA